MSCFRFVLMQRLPGRAKYPPHFCQTNISPFNENVSMEIKNVSMEILRNVEKSDRIPQEIKHMKLDFLRTAAKSRSWRL